MLDLFGRYVFRQVASAFLVVLLSLTAIVWVGSALKQLDLLTSKGQGFIIFFEITGLALPNLVSVIAPNALLMAALYTMDRLNGDSELIVASAAGAPVWRLGYPFVVMALIVSVVLMMVDFWLVPTSMRAMRSYVVQVRTDLISQVLQPGRFSSPDDDLTFHIRDRTSSGDLLGLMVYDGRDKSQIMTYLAKQGRIVNTGGGSYLVMQDGQIHRKLGEKLNSEVQIVEFKQYIFDISQFGPRSEINDFKPRERYISELINPNPEDDKLYRRNPGVFRAELHNRLSNPLYPLAFVMIVIMFVGQPRTIRESRWRALVLTFGTSVGLRLSGFAATNLTAQHSSAAILVYALPLGAILVAGLMAYVRMSPRGRLQWRLGFPRKLKFPNNNLWALMALPIERRRGRVG